MRFSAMRTVLVTGGYGFLGRAVAQKFKREGCRVFGIGRGRWAPAEARSAGFDSWLDAGVSVSSLMTFDEQFDTVIHCGGNGSVGYSLTNPLQDFSKTVQGTVELLEYLRLNESEALVVYPSSAGVYGAKEDRPIFENDSLNPISPYGYHKRMAEHLLELHSRTYGTRVAVIRFFSIYGQGLTKQLLWDACGKLMEHRNPEPAVFWGTGEETRDWIDSRDAADLVFTVSRSTDAYTVLNGANGKRVTVGDTLRLLKSALNSPVEIAFNGLVREGDPRFYHADISRAATLGWHPSVTLSDGIKSYVDWLIARPRTGID
jgi:UDP-glucose 4-epimerase